ncbi:hypothetical protein FPOAC2_07255 [Fusarium poae]|jgi:hypothetical protein|uniref:hypothetical protein n=1 Tax=Fusarium poae TaxID=36050 RepID=UPI001CEADE47|nr:hypothetical protein FPOAC1_007102 [Fusarium poae]KAG8673783.1 hypothetical protein FPOAC1_007102 [Fusarium poae]
MQFSIERDVQPYRLGWLSEEPVLQNLIHFLEFRFEFSTVEYESEDEELDEHLRFLALTLTLIRSTLPRCSNLEILKLDLDSGRYASGISNLQFERWVQDTQDLFRSFCMAAYGSGLGKLEELFLHLPISRPSQSLLEGASEAESAATSALFKQLKRLTLFLAITDDDEALDEFAEPPDEFAHNLVSCTYLQELLHLAPNLDQLVIRGMDDPPLTVTPSTLPHCHLRLLKLCNIFIAGETIMAVIKRCKSLEDVNLRNVYLLSGTWERVLTDLSKTSIIAFHIQFCGYAVTSDDSELEDLLFENFHITTDWIEDLKACESVFLQVPGNLRERYGINFDEVAYKAEKPTQTAAKLRHYFEGILMKMEASKGG